MSTFFITDGFGGDQYEFITGGLDSAPVSGFFITNGLGGSAFEYLMDGLSPSGALTQSVTTCTTTSWTGYSLQENQSPPVAVGDTFYADLVTSPGGYAITVNGDGTIVVDVRGDTTRQRFQADIYDQSLGAFYGSFTVFINNHAPQLNVQPANLLVLTGDTIAALDFTPTDPAATDYVIDQDAELITGVQISGSLPTGLSFAGNVLSGTPTSVVDTSVTFRFSDPAGEYVDVSMGIKTDPGAIVPNIVGLTQAEADANVSSVGLFLDTTTTDYSPGVPAGNVMAQDLNPGSRVFLSSTINATISLGPLPSGATVPDVVGLTQAAAEAALTAANLTAQIQEVYGGNAAAGVVIHQFPAAGSPVDAFSDVTIDVSQGAATVTINRHQDRRIHIARSRKPNA